ncbi:hypothetical protein E6H34_04230 [Candidatus Bathyarchaeota archaeon]|nr:MAG: hypothetical protein E6H34_04230 [Candidatus Bathyarchaeota archaeon]
MAIDVVTGLVRSYARLQQMIEQKERHPVSYWVNLIREVIVGLEGEADIKQAIPFEEFQKWARALGLRKGWIKE